MKKSMRHIPFIKMHGLGNSYIYIDTFHHPIDESFLPELAASVSCSATGIGSDGLITIGPSKIASVQMRIFNKDGSEGKNCGNGLRCVAKYVHDEGIVTTRNMTIETLSGIVNAQIISNEKHTAMIRINMGAPQLSRQAIPMEGPPSETVVAEPFEINGHTLKLTAVSMGNPHAIFFVRNIKDSLHATLGPFIEKDVRFPERTNVEFVAVESPTSLLFRVWERGSGITQACGTGACAAVVAAVLNGYCKKDADVIVHLAGGDLTIRWTSEGAVLMTGPAVIVATGILI